MTEPKVAVGTRFWGQKPEDIQTIRRFVHEARRITDQVFVAVNSDADKVGTFNDSELIRILGFWMFRVTPWGKFVMPLNALVMKATLAGCDHLLLASTEVALSPEILAQLMSHMNKNVLVVGAALEGHNLDNRFVNGDGRTTPWNTLSLWNLEHLSKIGFPLIGDALFDPTQAGVEEVSAIALLQEIFPRLSAKLVEIKGVEWNTERLDADRRAKHEAKMASKVSRPARQMEILGISPPTILHIRK